MDFSDTWTQMLIVWVGIAEKVSGSEVEAQGYNETKSTFVTEAYISTVWRPGLFVIDLTNESFIGHRVLLSWIKILSQYEWVVSNAVNCL